MEARQPLSLGRDHSVFSFDPATPPALEVEAGDTVVFETSDEAYERLAAGEPESAVWKRMNPVTGPVAVRDAAAGDVLSVEVISIEVLRAWVVWIPGFGGLGDKTRERRVEQTPVVPDPR